MNKADGWGSGHADSFKIIDPDDPGPMDRKELRKLRKRNKWNIHKEWAHQNKKQKVDARGSLEEWCEENEKAAPTCAVTEYNGYHKNTFVALVTVGDKTFQSPRAFSKAEAELEAFTMACKETSVEVKRVLTDAEKGVAASGNTNTFKNDGSFLEMFKKMQAEKEAKAKGTIAEADEGVEDGEAAAAASPEGGEDKAASAAAPVEEAKADGAEEDKEEAKEEVAEDAKEEPNYAKMTVKQLQGLLKDRGLETKGKKAVLIGRLQG